MPPKGVPANRKHLSLSEKLEVITYFNKTKCSIRKLAKQFRIGKTQAGQIIKQKDKFLELRLSNSEVKNGALRPDSIGFLVDKYVYQWYIEIKSENIPVSGPMIQNKALELAKKLGNKEFKASNGWLERFRIRHKISARTSTKRLRKLEKVEFNFDEWKKQLNIIHTTYTAENIFSAVETGLFFQAIPEDTPCFITETCSSGKLSDQRFTILFCISMAGIKEKPLVIAKPPKSTPDEGCDFSKFQVDCEFNSMAWMTGKVMTKWLKEFDKRMVRQKRTVVLFLNDAFSQYEPQLKNTKIMHFPSCLSSENQMPNQGVIQNFKIIYRQLLLKRLIELNERDEKDASSSQTIISQGISWVEIAWEELSESVIHRCFEEIGFTSLPNAISDNEAFLNDVSNLLCAYDSDINAIDYVSIDADLVTSVAQIEDPEFIEVLVDGNEMRDILMEEDEMDEKSVNVLLSNIPCSECMIDPIYVESNNKSPDTQRSEGTSIKSENVSSVTSYSAALRNLKDLELFYLSQNDSNGALLVNELIAHSELVINKQ